MQTFYPGTDFNRPLLGVVLITLIGCATPTPDPYPTVSPEVIVDGSPVPQAEPTPPASYSAPVPEPSGVPVQAMVGQIAGQPIYAHHVLDGLEPQLETLGRRLPAATFRERALELIYQRVAGLIRDALVTDAAERALTEQQLAGLDFFIASQREQLLRVYGQGSLALAERNFYETYGTTLAQRLRDIRTRTMVNIYLERNLNPLVNVSRRDIERFYRDNYEVFNPPTKRQIQLIYAGSEEDAAWFSAELGRGVGFDQLAADERNAYRGKATLLPLEGDSMFGDNVDPALQKLEQGQWAGPLPNRGQQWFVYVAELDEPVRRSLFEAQVDVERELRLRQQRQLQEQLGLKLRKEASVTDEEQMSLAVLEIAVARYAASR
ncbi:MAG: peptidyl-prolyl cis-trans isomerase [Planctomycetota bacterium]